MEITKRNKQLILDSYKREYTYLGIGDAGVYAEAPNKYSKHPASITIYDTRLSAYFGDLAEGGIVVDKRPCTNRDDFVKAVVSGPMRGSWLPEKTREGFGGNVSCNDANEAGALDYVSTDLYLDLWRDKGARIGKRVGDEIHWEDGKHESIVPVSQRWTVNN